MPDPIITAARDILDEALDELRRAVDGLDAGTLNTPPLPTETNSLAVLVVHALASSHMWLSLATGVEPPPRNRDAEFETVVSDPAAFLTEFDASAAACRELLGEAATFDPAAMRTPPSRIGSDLPEPVTAAWALLHAIAHINEHVGHAQLTRQRTGA